MKKNSSPYRVRFVNYSLQYQKLKKQIDRVITDVLERGDLILRSDVEVFEKKLADFIGSKFALGLNSGTDALFLSLKAIGIDQGDEVITVSHTFVASIATIVQAGATPILVDVGDDFVMDVSQIEKVITAKTKAIIPVHLNGRLVEMDKLMNLAQKYHLLVIEDAAQALGAKIKINSQWRLAGSIGVTGCFSFYPAKILGCFGDGGGLTTNNPQIAEKIRLWRDHGQKTKREIVCYGWNSRLDNLQAAVLNIKFKYLEQWIERRREIARIYTRGLKNIAHIKLPVPPDANPRFFDVFQNYVLRAQKRDELFQFLKEKGVETLIKDPIPNHLQPLLELSHFHLPVSEQLAKEVISLPMYPELTDGEIEYVINCVCQFYQK